MVPHRFAWILAISCLSWPPAFIFGFQISLKLVSKDLPVLFFLVDLLPPTSVHSVHTEARVAVPFFSRAVPGVRTLQDLWFVFLCEVIASPRLSAGFLPHLSCLSAIPDEFVKYLSFPLSYSPLPFPFSFWLFVPRLVKGFCPGRPFRARLQAERVSPSPLWPAICLFLFPSFPFPLHPRLRRYLSFFRGWVISPRCDLSVPRSGSGEPT